MITKISKHYWCSLKERQQPSHIFFINILIIFFWKISLNRNSDHDAWQQQRLLNPPPPSYCGKLDYSITAVSTGAESVLSKLGPHIRRSKEKRTSSGTTPIMQNFLFPIATRAVDFQFKPVTVILTESRGLITKYALSFPLSIRLRSSPPSSPSSPPPRRAP
jgi:hypothetical protein